MLVGCEVDVSFRGGSGKKQSRGDPGSVLSLECVVIQMPGVIVVP